MNMNVLMRNLTAGIALVLLASCGGGSNPLPDAQEAAADFPQKPTLSVAAGSLLAQRSDVRFSMQEGADGITATIELAEGAQLRTLYTDIAYDPRRLSLDSIETAAELGGRQLLSLGLDAEPGLVQTGH